MDYFFFYQSSSPFSQWHHSPFTTAGEDDDEELIKFHTAEHYMMYQKAKMFFDNTAMQAILATKSPAAAKAIGRKVRGFEKERWEYVCLDVIYRGNRLKFEQNPKLMADLKLTAGKKMVECSPSDKIYGCGFAMDDTRRWNEEKWTGTNWLGEVLTELRDDFQYDRAKQFSSLEFY